MDIFFNYINDLILLSKENYLFSILIFFIFLFFYSCISLPGLLIFFILSGYLFGIFHGYLISIISITFGSLIFFIFSKIFFKYFFQKYYLKYANSVNQFISNSSLEYLIIFRMIPGTPLMLQNIILSLLNISIIKFIAVSLIGFTPFVFTLVLIGNKISDLNSIKEFNTASIFSWDFLLLLFVLIFFIFLRIKFKNKKRPS